MSRKLPPATWRATRVGGSVIATDGTTVAFVPQSPTFDRKATADLLATTPELLAVLKALGGYAMTAQAHNTPEWLEGLLERIQEADAVIEKATGEAP